MKARFENVATVDGQSVDLFAEVLEQSTTKTNTFWQGGEWALPGDIVFQFLDGYSGENRWATVRWTFLINGTNTPIHVEGLNLTIDDLDDGSSRQESLETADALGYTLNNPTNISATMADGIVEVDAIGGSEHSAGDPEAAVRLHMKDATSFTITYYTTLGSASVSAFHHDGNGDFNFTNPTYTPVPPTPPRLYFTYDFSNDTGSPIEASFADELPAGLLWDTGYTPATTNGLTVDVVYSNGDKNATIDPLTLPPGDSQLKLATLDVAQGGTISNSSTLTVGEMTIEPEGGSAEITLPPTDNLILTLAGSEIAGYALIVTDGDFTLDGNNAGVAGKVAVTQGVTQNLISGGITGDYVVHPPGSGTTGSVDTLPGGGGEPISQVSQNLFGMEFMAVDMSVLGGGMPPTQVLGTLDGTTTINGGSTNGLNVISVQDINLSGQDDLIINGSQYEYFLINVQGEMKFSGQSEMILSGGVTGSHVIFNMLPGSSKMEFTGQGDVHGVFFAIQNGNSVNVSGNGDVNGTVIGRAVSILGNGKIVHVPFQ